MDSGDRDAALPTLRARVHTIARQRPAALAWSLGLMAVAVYALWGTATPAVLLGWWCANALFALWRLLVWRRQRIDAPAMTAAQALAWLRESMFANGLNGLVWGIGAFAFLDAARLGVFVIFLMILTALTCGAAISLAAWLPSVVAFCVPVTALAAARILLLDFDNAGFIALSCFIYLAFVLTVARNYASLVSTAIELQHRNAALLAQTQAQKQTVERISRERSSLFAALGHDLRQPLYAMGLLLDSLGKRLDGDEQRRLHADIGRARDALDDLFSSLLDFARLDSASLPVRRERFRIDSLLQELATEFEPAAAASGLGLEVRAEPCLVSTDRLLLSRVLRNLLSNALKFTDNGAVRLSASEAAAGVEVCVRDTGRGIAPAEQARVFGEYYRAAGAEQDKRAGLGLGLAVVRRLCEALELPLSMQSAPGVGTEFRILVPAADSAADEATAGSPLAGLHVLFIDDDPVIRRAMTALLVDHDCLVTTAASARQALGVLPAEARAVDILVSDFRLGAEEEGLAAVGTLRRALDPRLPALIITADTDPDTARRIADAGLALLYKPVPSERLLAAVAERV